MLIIAMGVVFLATPFVGMLNREWHSESLLRLAGRGGPLVAGAAFAIAWTPCTSITLGAILTQAAISSSAAHGALLLAFYSAGLAIPFLLIALAFERMTAALAVVKRHFPVIIAIGGAVMIVLGLLILTGEFTILNAEGSAARPAWTLERLSCRRLGYASSGHRDRRRRRARLQRAIGAGSARGATRGWPPAHWWRQDTPASMAWSESTRFGADVAFSGASLIPEPLLRRSVGTGSSRCSAGSWRSWGWGMEGAPPAHSGGRRGSGGGAADAVSCASLLPEARFPRFLVALRVEHERRVADRFDDRPLIADSGKGSGRRTSTNSTTRVSSVSFQTSWLKVSSKIMLSPSSQWRMSSPTRMRQDSASSGTISPRW